MTRPLHIVAADDDAAIRLFYERSLRDLGHQVHAVPGGRDLVELCRAARPDLLIVAIPMRGADGFAAAAEVCRDGPVPVILVSAHHGPEGLIERAAPGCILACMTKPVTEAALALAITVAMRNFEQYEGLRREVADLRQALEDGEVVERAKGAVMRHLGVGEDEADRRIRKVARDRNVPLFEVARGVLEAEVLLAPLEQVAPAVRPRSEGGAPTPRHGRAPRRPEGPGHHRDSPGRRAPTH
jgi:response regulator NasT